VLHWAATHAQGVEVVGIIAGVLETKKDRALVTRRQQKNEVEQQYDPAYLCEDRGLFGQLSLIPDAEKRLPLSRATYPEVIHAMCRHGADPRDDGYSWKQPRSRIYPAICYAQSPEVYDALVACMGAEVQVTPYQAEHAATSLTLRLMSSKHPLALGAVLTYADRGTANAASVGLSALSIQKSLMDLQDAWRDAMSPSDLASRAAPLARLASPFTQHAHMPVRRCLHRAAGNYSVHVLSQLL